MTRTIDVPSQTEEWNDSLKGEFLWSSVNTREGIPDVMTPSTWSLWRIYYVDANPVKLPEKYPFAGNIGGRPYLNLSLVVSMYRAVGKDIRKEMHGDIIGSISPDLDIPIIPFSPPTVVWMVLPGMVKARRYASRAGNDLARFLAETPTWCSEIRSHIQHTQDKNILGLLWQKTIHPYFSHCCNLLRSVTMQFTDQSNRLRLELVGLVGEARAFTLMSRVNTHPAGLESLMPVLGLANPPYPSIIIGKFDPFQWAVDPDRRSDVFDSRASRITAGDRIKGFPGAAGCVEGLVRRIDRMEDGYQVRPGEILVTITTNVGWTPLFPRLAAVVTDVGAPLSHAAIVAREMGIPAVVGCGNATMRLKTGDRVRVDGSAGMVEVIEGEK